MSNPQGSVMDILFGRWRSQILYAGVRLGVFDALRAGAKTADDVASELHLSRPHTYRLLRTLAGLGLLSEDRNRSFSLTASGGILARRSPADPAGHHVAGGRPGTLRRLRRESERRRRELLQAGYFGKGRASFKR